MNICNSKRLHGFSQQYGGGPVSFSAHYGWPMSGGSATSGESESESEQKQNDGMSKTTIVVIIVVTLICVAFWAFVGYSLFSQRGHLFGGESSYQPVPVQSPGPTPVQSPRL